MTRTSEHGVSNSLCLCAGLLLLGCVKSGAVFKGQQSEPLRSAPQVIEFADLPSGFQELGTVRVRCTSEEPAFGQLGVGSSKTVPLSELLCSEELLTFALRERAARVGGTALIGRRCNNASDETERHIFCDAKVARASAIHSSEGDTVSPSYDQKFPEAPLLEDMDDAWRIQITFTATHANAARQSRSAHLVNEGVTVPVQDVILGDLIARCPDGCEGMALRESLRVAAGRLGASDVVGVQCVRKGQSLICTGRAAAPQSDPRVVSSAR